MRIAQHATDVRLSILLTVIECFSAFLLAVALYGITRDQDFELATLALVGPPCSWWLCRFRPPAS